MEQFNEWLKWDHRRRVLDGLSRNLRDRRDPSWKEAPSTHYKMALDLLERISCPERKPTRTESVRKGGVAIFATEISPAFFSYFIKQEVPDSEYAQYMINVFVGLNEAYVAKSEQRRVASELLAHLASYCEEQARERTPVGNI